MRFVSISLTQSGCGWARGSPHKPAPPPKATRAPGRGQQRLAAAPARARATALTAVTAAGARLPALRRLGGARGRDEGTPQTHTQGAVTPSRDTPKEPAAPPKRHHIAGRRCSPFLVRSWDTGAARKPLPRVFPLSGLAECLPLPTPLGYGKRRSRHSAVSPGHLGQSGILPGKAR